MKHVVIGTAGHIDHGKSALVRALTGTDPDRLKEEKVRGITIDLGFAHCQDGETNFAFVDVPGHERFVKNMLAGASGIDCVLFVVAADESVMPQTREHFDICRLLHVAGGVVVLTKIDLVDAETIELVRLEARELIAGSFLGRAPIVPVSAKTTEGLQELRAALAGAARGVLGRSESGPVRLPIDRAFSVKGFGTVVTGTQVSGRMGVDSELVVLPSNRRVKVRGVQVHGQKQTIARAGQRAAVNLGGIEVTEVSRGDTLATPGCFEATRRFDAVLELLSSARPLRHGARVRFHQRTSEVLGRVAVAGLVPLRSTSQATADNADEVGASTAIRPGGRAYVQIRLERPAVLTRGDRYIVRAYSPPITIAGGYVLDPQPARSGVRSSAAGARFQRLDHEGPGEPGLEEAVSAMIDERGPVGLMVAALRSRAGVAPEAVDELVRQLVQQGRAVLAGDVLVAAGILAALKQRLLEEIAAYHRAQPLLDGLPREEARERLFGRANPAVFDRVLQDLVAAGQIFARDRLGLASHALSLSGDEAHARDTIERVLRSAGLRPPDLASLSAATGLEPAVTDRMVKLLVRQKVLVRIETLLFHSDALRRLKEEVIALRAARGERVTIDVGSFKEHHGISRKFAIPLLEYLDRERVTRRVGEVRVVI